jgi:hypothetical protein
VANGGDVVAVAESGPASWDEVVRVVPCMDAVVKVFCVHTEPNFSLPWQRKRQYSSSSSGFIIGGRRVLTNAHSVEHYTQVKLKKRGSDTKYLATVLAIGTECDIGAPALPIPATVSIVYFLLLVFFLLIVMLGLSIVVVKIGCIVISILFSWRNTPRSFFMVSMKLLRL